MLKLLRLTFFRLARVENARNPACCGAMLISPVLFGTPAPRLSGQASL
ncbi:hypothetical protein U8330_21325 [Rhizobium sp. CC-YZS058]|nr:hypothetical protein [Rhizobium sp. CC-YZS058]